MEQIGHGAKRPVSAGWAGSPFMQVIAIAGRPGVLGGGEDAAVPLPAVTAGLCGQASLLVPSRTATGRPCGERLGVYTRDPAGASYWAGGAGRTDKDYGWTAAAVGE